MGASIGSIVLGVLFVWGLAVPDFARAGTFHYPESLRITVQRPELFRIAGSSHGGGTTLTTAIEQRADGISFLMDQLGMVPK